ncbi:MAG: pseudouridine synthase [Actinobacteria bacterium]|nr:pseudouridine synthase [Actinomycetota bacterium]
MPEATNLVRLQKALANAGVASRRACEELITRGAVKVNGKLVVELGTKIDPTVDKVTVKGVPVVLDTGRIYLALNKPAGVISSMSDEEGRPDLSQFVLDYDRVYNVGRLDGETTGLLLLTNDGELAHKLAHPSFGVEKTYVAKVTGSVSQSVIRELLQGFELEDGFIQADSARILEARHESSLIEVVLHSGRNRIVRRMLEHVGHPVTGLVRKQFGPIHLGTLKAGMVRELTKLELGALLKAAEGSDKPQRQRPRNK